MTVYSPPVSALLTYGSCLERDQTIKDPEQERILKAILAAKPGEAHLADLTQIKRSLRPKKWPNYLQELGITSADIPELIRMMTDDGLNWADSESSEVWAPVHAWRCLGFLRAEAAIAPLIDSLGDDEGDWLMEEVPWVFGLIGESAIAPISLHLANRGASEWSRIILVSALEYTALLHSNLKDTCIEKLASQLADYAHNPESLNGFLVSSLVELEAVSKAPLMSRAFSAKRVDDTICGNWPDVKIEMGLATEADFTPEELAHRDHEWVYDPKPNRKLKELTDRQSTLLPKWPQSKPSSEQLPQGFGAKNAEVKGKKKKPKKKKR